MRCKHKLKDNDWFLDWVSQWTEQALLHTCSKHEQNKLYYMHVINMNQKTMIDLIDWTRHLIVSLLQWHESIVSLLQWHQITRRNKLEMFDEMSLKHLIQQDEMSLKHLNRMIIKWTRKKKLIEVMKSLLDWEKKVMLQACSVFYWNARSLSKSKTLLNLMLILLLYI